MLKDIKAFQAFTQKKELEIAVLKEQKVSLENKRGKGNKAFEEFNAQINKQIEEILAGKQREQDLTNHVAKLNKKLAELRS